jgi:hypothetical protein
VVRWLAVDVAGRPGARWGRSRRMAVVSVSASGTWAVSAGVVR